MTEIIARRQFAPLYIWLAIGVLVQFGWEADSCWAASAARALHPSAKSSVP